MFRKISITYNFLDRRFQKMLFPFQFMKHMFFISSFSVSNNCIRAQSMSYYIVSLIGTLVFVIFHSLTYFNVEYFGYYSLFLKYFSKFNSLFLLTSFITFYFINIVQSKDNVQLILKIQKAFKIINYKNYKIFTICNWITILLQYVTFFVWASLLSNFRNAYFFYTLIYFEVNVTYAICVISLIRDGMVTWISEVEYYAKLSLELEEEIYSNNLKNLFQAYIDLLEAFNIFQRIFQFFVSLLLLFCNLFCLGLLFKGFVPKG